MSTSQYALKNTTKSDILRRGPPKLGEILALSVYQIKKIFWKTMKTFLM